jgi:hypothetical protein
VPGFGIKLDISTEKRFENTPPPTRTSSVIQWWEKVESPGNKYNSLRATNVWMAMKEMLLRSNYEV